jgi:hypothetical protein
MTSKAEFNAEEWSEVVEGPLFAGLHVVAAERGGTLRETLAMGKAYQAARAEQDKSELLDEIVSSPPAVDPGRMQAGEDVAVVSRERLGAAIGVVRDKASAEEVEAYKRFVIDVAQAAARAHREGGFLGIGGKDVSDKEQAALDDITATLETAPG